MIPPAPCPFLVLWNGLIYLMLLVLDPMLGVAFYQGYYNILLHV